MGAPGAILYPARTVSACEADGGNGCLHKNGAHAVLEEIGECVDDGGGWYTEGEGTESMLAVRKAEDGVEGGISAFTGQKGE